MTRRIAGTFLALLTALLVLAVVPLGVSLSTNQRTNFRFDANSAARTVADGAEEHLSDHHSEVQMQTALATAEAQGDCAVVYLDAATVLTSTPCRASFGAAPGALAAQVFAEHGTEPEQDTTAQVGQWLLIGVPVGDNGEVSGAIVYARSYAPVDDRIEAMWGWLVATGLGCLALAALLAVHLARWVSRPLQALGETAGRLGEGDLSVRTRPQKGGPDPVRRLAETFDWMAERIETLVRSHRWWIADVSHQLRTPLTALRLRLDLLAADVPDEEAAVEFAAAQDEVARLSRLVDGLLAVARAEAATPSRKPVRLDLVAHERVTTWEPLAQERGVDLSVRAPSALTVALGAGDLEQILDNLVANALEAVAEQGRVRLEAVAHDGRALLRVIDDGPGMSDAAKAAAFHRYGHPEPRGNGLGLAIVHRLTAANGGSAALHDTPGGGLTVELAFPASAAAA